MMVKKPGGGVRILLSILVVLILAGIGLSFSENGLSRQNEFVFQQNFESDLIPLFSISGVGLVPGPDVIIGDVFGLTQLGTSGTQVGLAMGTEACNAGAVDVEWFALPNSDHPVIPENLYRLSGGASNDERFEQIGQSSARHQYFALAANSCGFGCNGVSGNHLGSGCSTTDSATINGAPQVLGSRAWVNPFTGTFSGSGPSPSDHNGHTHTGTSHRILTEIDDLNTSLNPGAAYYAEAQVVTPHEGSWCQSHADQCNFYNNVSYRRFGVAGTNNFTFSAIGSTMQSEPAIYAWPGATRVQIEPDPGNDGIGVVAYKVTNPSPGVWHYEYAIYNHNLDRAIQSFSMPIDASVTLSNIGFHAPPQHPGWATDGTFNNAGYSSAPWIPSQIGGALLWNCETIEQDQNANAIRWGTMYNFRFDSDKPPENKTATIRFFKTGSPITVSLQGPAGDPPPTATSTPTYSPTHTATSTPTPTATGTPVALAIHFSTSIYMEDESQIAEIKVTRDGTNIDVTNNVSFSTADGSAMGGAACSPGVDYISVTNQTVTFNPGEREKTVGVTVCADTSGESDQTVNLSLTGPNVVSPSTAVLTINDTATAFRNSASIDINQGLAASPFPSTITVTGGPTTIQTLRVTVYDYATENPDNVDLLLVGPTGHPFILMANAGGSSPVNVGTLNFIDTAGAVLPDNTFFFTGDYEPTSYGTVANFPAPAPTGPYPEPGGSVGGNTAQSLEGNYRGGNSNGNWSLYVRDDNAAPGATVGHFAGGWGIEFSGSTQSTPTATATNTPTPPTPTATATGTPFTAIQFTSPTYIEDESQTAAITIDRLGTRTNTDSVSFSTSNGTATGGAACTTGVDYISVTNQMVTFAPGATTQTVNVTMCADSMTEADETINLTLTGPNLGSPSTAVLAINDTATAFRNDQSIIINRGGAGGPYPSTISVAGGPTTIGSMRVTIYDYVTPNPDNVDLLLLGPGGQKFVIMANAGGTFGGFPVTINFTDTAGAVIPDDGPVVTADYEPTSFGTVNPFPSPGPLTPYNLPGGTVGGSGTETLSGNFGGTNSNGTWRLYLRDHGSGGGPTGSVAGGWGIEFTGSATPTPTPLPVCSPRVLWDQLAGGLGTNGTASQDFETANNAFDSEAADDFALGSGETFVVQKVIARGIYFNGPGPADSFNVTFYYPGSTPSTVRQAYTGLSYTQDGDKFIIDIPNFTWCCDGWVSVQARMDFSPGGQWAWLDREQYQFLTPARWRNPGGGYSTPQCADFAQRGATCNIDPAYTDQAFQMIGFSSAGCTIPTPTASPTFTATASPTPTNTLTPTNTPTPTFTPTLTPTPSGTPTATPTGTPLPVCTPRVLWDQMDNGGTGATASQDFEPSLDAFDAVAMDDFMIGSGQCCWKIQKVVVRGRYFNGSGPADSFNVTIAGHVFSGLSYTTNGDEFSIPLPSSVNLTAVDIYPISVQAKMDFADHGQWAWVDRSAIVGLFVAKWKNPGGGYMTPQCVDFANRGATCGIDPNFPEQSFRLEGVIGDCSTPTPTATASPTMTPSPSPTGSPSITGTVRYGNATAAPNPRFVSNVLMIGSGNPNVSTFTSFPDGTYSLGGFGAGSYTVTPLKTSGQNSITSFDAARISQHVAGVNPLTGNQTIVADVSGNGTISSFDSAEVAGYVVSTPPIGSTGMWRFTPASRTYPSVTIDIPNQDYSALLMGEVSGNWMDTGPRPGDSGQLPTAVAENNITSRSAGPERAAAVTAPRVVTPANNEVIVPINVENVGNKGVIAYEFDLRYDPAVLLPQKTPVDVVGTVSRDLSAVANAEEPGLLRVAVYGPTPINSSGVLVNLRFSAVGAPGSVSPLKWEHLLLNEGDPETTATDGEVVIAAAAPTQAEISGRLLTSSGRGVPHARITLTSTAGTRFSTLSNGFGVFRFSNVQIGQTYTLTVDTKHYTFTPMTVSVLDQQVNIDVISTE